MAVQRKYLQMFLEEGSEILSKLNQRILALEETPSDAEALQSALRLAHTLKGGAKMVGLDNVSRAGHTLESALKAATAGGAALSREQGTRFLGVLDRIREALDLVAANRDGEALALDLSAPASPRPAAAPYQPRPQPPRPAAAKAPQETDRRLGSDRVRVSVEKLDSLQNLVDDLVLQRARLVEQVSGFRRAFAGLESVAWADDERELTDRERARVGRVVRLLGGRGFAGFLEELHQLEQTVSEVQGQVFDLRMVPLAEVLDEHYRTVRDLAAELGKDVALVIDGRFTEIDKRLLEAVQAPLMHLVRNAVDHGLEAPADRVQAGKPARGTVTIRAYHKGSAVVLEVEDDGRGLDPEVIRRKAVEKGALGEEQARSAREEELYYLLCEPGFTTREAVTEVSGRGVGLDVVKVRVEKLKGSLAIQSEPGRFTRFRMFLPLSISSLSALVVRAGGTRFALPTLFVDRCHKIEAAALQAQGGTWVHAGRALPVVSLARGLGLETQGGRERVSLVVLQFRGRHMVLQVDELEEEREIILKPLGNHLRHVPFVLGVSFLRGGDPVPVLNVIDLHARWTVMEATSRFDPQSSAPPPLILVADDSMTTRHMEQNVLESLGYRVIATADGLEAWKVLDKQRVDLVLTDVEMPGVDGLELTRRIRAREATADLPVVAVSSRASDEDLEAGFLAGVDAYIRKDRFSQKELGETLTGLLARHRAPAGAPTGTRPAAPRPGQGDPP